MSRVLSILLPDAVSILDADIVRKSVPSIFHHLQKVKRIIGWLVIFRFKDTITDKSDIDNNMRWNNQRKRRKKMREKEFIMTVGIG
jgi:hypothetical protein